MGSALPCLQIAGIWENPRWNGIGSEQVQERIKGRQKFLSTEPAEASQFHRALAMTTFCADAWQLELLPLLLDAACGLRETG